MEPYIVTFLGNKEVSDRQSAFDKTFSLLETLFTGGSETASYFPIFYCGGYGDFGNIASEAIDALRERYPDLESEKLFITPYLTPSYSKTNKYMKQFYDEIVYPPLENVPPQFAIARRNQWMIDRCDLLIAYMEDTTGNTRKCVEYAVRKNKEVAFVDSGETKKLLFFGRRGNRKLN